MISGSQLALESALRIVFALTAQMGHKTNLLSFLLAAGIWKLTSRKLTY